MARGWESKSVESQIEEFEHSRAPNGKSTEMIQQEQERASIELTRTRVLHDIATATHPRYRDQLEAALRHLDQRLAAIEARNKAS
jgi:hypothetical protein